MLKLAPRVSAAEKRIAGLFMEVLKVMFGNNCSVTKQNHFIIRCGGFFKFREAAVRWVIWVDDFRVFTDFNLLLLLLVCSFTPLLSSLSPPDSCLPPSLHQLPEELSVWIAALSVQPVRLRDVFWSAVDTDRAVRWDDSRKWRRTHTGTCNVTRLLHPCTTATTRLPHLHFWKINIHVLEVGRVHKGWACFLTSWGKLFFWAWADVMQPRDVVRLEHQFAIMSTCTLNVTSAHGLNEIKGNRSLSTYFPSTARSRCSGSCLKSNWNTRSQFL